MLKFKLICPECHAVVLIHSPESAIWEHCPSCGRHIWDNYDMMMADIYDPGNSRFEARNVQGEN